LPAQVTDPVVGLLSRLGITPNALTVAGFLGNCLAAALAASGMFVAAGALMLLFSLLDAFDGALARATGRATAFGSVLDATLDRVSEAAVLFGLAFYFSGQGNRTMTLVLMAALIGSVLVSYVRARVEVTGARLTDGFFTRAVRVAVLGVSMILFALLGIIVIEAIIWVLAVMTNVTAAHRLFLAWQKLDRNEPGQS
jgi:CDP-diacylglycerol--glycerol-3-phosphate 3-phosphatidyltransferase